MILLTIAATDLRRLIAQRSNIFFLLILPLLLILVLGSSIAGFEPRIGVVAEGDATGFSDDFIDQLARQEGIQVSVFGDQTEAIEQLQREDITALVVLPGDYGETLLKGETAIIDYLALPDGNGFKQQGLIQRVVSEQSLRVRAARLVVAEVGTTASDANTVTNSVAESTQRTTITPVDSNGDPYEPGESFSLIAAQELVLFIFLTAMIAASALIQSRKLGIVRRMLATPASSSEIVGGILLGRLGISLVQGLAILAATSLLFSANWGSFPASLAIVFTFSLVATAVAVLIGSLFQNENQTSAVGLSLGLGFAAIGGCMVPLEIFPDTLRTAAHVTPHAWAVDAFTEVIQRGGGLGDIITELAVLVVYATVLLGLSTVVLRRTITN